MLLRNATKMTNTTMNLGATIFHPQFLKSGKILQKSSQTGGPTFSITSAKGGGGFISQQNNLIDCPPPPTVSGDYLEAFGP